MVFTWIYLPKIEWWNGSLSIVQQTSFRTLLGAYYILAFLYNWYLIFILVVSFRLAIYLVITLPIYVVIHISKSLVG